MRRREFLAGLGGAAGWPLVANAQRPERLRSVGVLMNFQEGDAEGKVRLSAFLQRMKELGWSEDRNLKLFYRWSGADVERMRGFAKELVALAPDLIVGVGTPVVRALAHETSSIPILFTQVSDPIGSGIVPNLARPGGNITGFTLFEFSIGSKWLQTIKDIAPSVAHVGVVFNPATDRASGVVALLVQQVEASAPMLVLV